MGDFSKVRAGKASKVSSEPLINQVFQWLRDNPQGKQHGKLRKLAFDLGLDYKKYKGYLWKLSSQWKTDQRNEQRSRLAVRSKPDEQHGVFLEVFVPGCLDRKRFGGVEENAVLAGWRLSMNRNRILIWDKEQASLGRVQWWMTGRVHVHLVRPILMARVKTLLYHAFCNTGLINDWEIMDKFVNSVDWYSSHDVYGTPDGKALPYMKITTYEVLGVKCIKTGDFSHRDKLEVEVAKPRIAEKFEELAGKYEALVGVLYKKEASDAANREVFQKVVESNTQTIQQFNAFLEEVSSPKNSVIRGKLDRMYE